MRNVVGLLFLVVSIGLAEDCDRNVPITVLNDSDQSITFPAQRLQASIEDHPVVISHFKRIVSNRILLLFDVSASMRKARFSQNLLDALLEQTPPGSSLAYGFFNDKVKLSDGFTINAEQIRKALEELHTAPIKGRTALYDALDQGLKLFQKPVPGDSIFLISDGGENQSRASQKQLKADLRESGVRLFAIVPIHPAVLPEEELAPGLLADMAQKTGGRAIAVRDADPDSSHSIIKAIRILWLEAVGSGYLLTVRLPANLRKPIRWKLHLDTSGDKQFKGVSVSYPEQLMPCSNGAASAH